MSRYSQSEIISIVNSILPDIKETGDPHTSLLKMAKEKNLPVSVLEKCGQVYNTAKTLNYFDKVDSVEKRGATFKILDVPALVSAYTDWKPKGAEKAATSFFDPEDVGYDPYEVPVEFNPNKTVTVENVSLWEAALQEKTATADQPADLVKLHKELKVAERNAETARDVYNDFTTKVARHADLFLDKHYNTLDNKPAMDVLEKEASILFKDPEVTKELFDILAARATGYVRQQVKRASDSTQTRRLIKTSAVHTDLKELHELVKLAGSASDLVHEMQEEVKKKGSLIKKASPYWKDLTDGDLDALRAAMDAAASGSSSSSSSSSSGDGGTKTKRETKKETKREKEPLDPKEEARRAAEKELRDMQRDRKLDQDWQDEDLKAEEWRRSRERKQERWKKEDEEKAKAEQEAAEAAALQAETERIEGIGTVRPYTGRAGLSQTSSDPGVGRDAEVRSGRSRMWEYVNSVVPNVAALTSSMATTGRNLDAMSDTIGRYTNAVFTPEHERYQRNVDRAATFAQFEATLNTLLLTDPIISEYDEETMREVAFAILERNPSVATSAPQLKAVLRVAGQFDGMDMASVTELTKLRAEEAKSKANERAAVK